MPTYEYECKTCGHRFEQFQSISDAPVMQCPECQGTVKRLLSGGSGFIMKGGATASTQSTGCGKTAPCCGATTLTRPLNVSA